MTGAAGRAVCPAPTDRLYGPETARVPAHRVMIQRVPFLPPPSRTCETVRAVCGWLEGQGDKEVKNNA